MAFSILSLNKNAFFHSLNLSFRKIKCGGLGEIWPVFSFWLPTCENEKFLQTLRLILFFFCFLNF
ncbi:MAG: hypothetical protein D6805_01570 [Planctomycetota bacterium]|nr:MAG: hypothetical protein D6805_01570 [Planctomycetota bacterium]